VKLVLNSLVFVGASPSKSKIVVNVFSLHLFISSNKSIVAQHLFFTFFARNSVVIYRLSDRNQFENKLLFFYVFRFTGTHRNIFKVGCIGTKSNFRLQPFSFQYLQLMWKSCNLQPENMSHVLCYEILF
jgi:hypothetical protein